MFQVKLNFTSPFAGYKKKTSSRVQRCFGILSTKYVLNFISPWPKTFAAHFHAPSNTVQPQIKLNGGWVHRSLRFNAVDRYNTSVWQEIRQIFKKREKMFNIRSRRHVQDDLKNSGYSDHHVVRTEFRPIAPNVVALPCMASIAYSLLTSFMSRKKGLRVKRLLNAFHPPPTHITRTDHSQNWRYDKIVWRWPCCNVWNQKIP